MYWAKVALKEAKSEYETWVRINAHSLPEFKSISIYFYSICRFGKNLRKLSYDFGKNQTEHSVK